MDSYINEIPENLFFTETVSALLAPKTYIPYLLCGFRHEGKPHSRRDMEFFEGGPGKLFYTKKFPPYIPARSVTIRQKSTIHVQRYRFAAAKTQ